VVAGPVHGTVVDVQRRAAVDEDVVGHAVVASPADERCARDLVEHVPADLRPAEHVVQVDAHAPFAPEARNVVQVVVPDQRSSHGPVAPRVDGPRVVGLGAHVVDLVALHPVVVPTERDGLVRGIVNEVTRRRAPDAVERDGRLVHAVPSTVVVHVVVVRHVATGRQREPVAARERDAAIADAVDVAPSHRVLRAARHAHGPASKVAQRAPEDSAGSAPLHRDAVPAGRLDGEPSQADVADVLHLDEVAGNRYDGSPLVRWPGRPEVEQASLAVHVVLAWSVELAQ